MALNSKGNVIQAGNWIMVLVAFTWTGYVYYQMMAPPRSAPVVLKQLTPSEPGPGVAGIRTPSNQTTNPVVSAGKATTASSRGPTDGTATPPNGRLGVARPNDGAPYVNGPSVPIKSLNPGTFPPGMGPDN